MPKRQWYPKDLIDEVLPPARYTPEAWLAFLDPQQQDLLDGYDRYLANSYSAGDEIVFQYCEHRGCRTVRIMPDGTLAATLRCPETPDMFDGHLTLADGDALPSASNSFWEYESEIWAETLEQFAAAYAEICMGGETEAQDVDVQCAFWSENHTFRISADGKSLIPVSTPEHPAAAAVTAKD